jgi:hypothetical protein
MDRIAAMGGGVAVQHRMAFQGEYFVDRYGAKAAEETPPVARMLEAGLPLGAGTDATRVASYNPWTSLAWLVTGRSVGGLRLTPAHRRVSREQALRLWTEANAWFSSEAGRRASSLPAARRLRLADRGLLLSPRGPHRGIESALTVLGGRVVHAPTNSRASRPRYPRRAGLVAREGSWRSLECAASRTEGRGRVATPRRGLRLRHRLRHPRPRPCLAPPAPVRDADRAGFWGALGCGCWAV